MNELKQEAKSEITSPERLEELANLSHTLARIVAANPIAPSELLEKLGKKRSLAIQKAVVSNPNTPPETLITLGARFPQQLLKNPVFNLLILENPDIISKFPVDTLYNLLQQKNIPQFLLESAAKHQDEEIVEVSDLHINFAGDTDKGHKEIIKNKIKENNPKSKIYQNSDCLAAKCKCDFNYLSNFIEFIPDIISFSEYFKLAIVLNPYSSKNLIDRILLDKESNILQILLQDRYLLFNSHLVSNNNISTQIFKYIMEDKEISDDYDFLCTILAVNKNTPLYLLEELTDDEDLRSLVLNNPNFLKNKDNKLSSTEKINPKINYIKDTSELEHKAESRDSHTRENVASNPNIPENILKKLAVDENQQVRENAVKNLNITIDILKASAINEVNLLKNCKKDYFAMCGGGDDGQLYIDCRMLVLRNIVQHHKCTFEIKEFVFKNYILSKPSSFGRLAYFFSQYSDSKYLAKNFNSTYWLERYAIAQNIQTPTRTLKKLAEDANRIVRAAAIDNLSNR